MIVIVMGVAGSGKTTIGGLLAHALGCPFLDADGLHPRGNIDKMRRGVPLTDADRLPWLEAIHARMGASFDRGEDLVVACSALRRPYREVLARDLPVSWVYLRGREDLIRSRISSRHGHFVGPELLASQIEALEEPTDAIAIDVSEPPVEIVERIVKALRATRPNQRVARRGEQVETEHREDE